MKDTEIVEVLEDGTIYHFDLDICNAEADKALEQLYAKENVQLGFDYTATIFSLFVSCIHTLTTSGWSTTDLLDEVVSHSQADDICQCDDLDE
jgi:hypothetical protein